MNPIYVSIYHIRNLNFNLSPKFENYPLLCLEANCKINISLYFMENIRITEKTLKYIYRIGTIS